MNEGMELALDDVLDRLGKIAIPVDSSEYIQHVGTISANGDEIIGKAIASAMDRVGIGGIITIEDAKGMDTSLELVDGIRLDRGYTSPYFVNDVERMQVSYENAYVLVSNRQFKSMTDLIPILEKVIKESKPILIIADEVDGEALKLLTANKMQGKLECCVIVAPGRGDHRINLLGDIACITGASLIADGDGRSLSDLTLNDLGICGKITVTRTHTTLIQGNGNEELRLARKSAIEHLLKEQYDDTEIKKTQARLAILGGAAAIIKVGGATEIEMGERKDRIVDALNATQAAAEEIGRAHV
jgi:chaperonin GroEL